MQLPKTKTKTAISAQLCSFLDYSAKSELLYL